MKGPFLAALSSVAVLAALTATAAERDPQVGAYLSWKFGAAQQATVPNNFHYGLRLDYDSYLAMRNEVPPTLLLNVSGDKQINAFLNGSNLNELATRLNQAEAAAAAGGSTALTAAAVVAGVAVVAVVASNSSGDNNNDGNGTGGTGAGGAGGGTGGNGTGGAGGGPGGNGTGGDGGGTGGAGGGGAGGGTGGLLGGLGGLIPSYSEWRVSARSAPAPGGAEPRGIDADYQKHLDGGTGYMGDLH